MIGRRRKPRRSRRWSYGKITQKHIAIESMKSRRRKRGQCMKCGTPVKLVAYGYAIIPGKHPQVARCPKCDRRSFEM